jgi:acetyl-CoA C-acetyltransferase/acetyl-CoA acyltransferase
VDNLNLYSCSKVSDGASAIAVVSEAGLKRIGIPKHQAIEVIGYGQVEEDLTQPPKDLTELSTTKQAISEALANAGITVKNLRTAEVHDCFSIAGVLAVEALGLARKGKGPDYILAGNTTRKGKTPINTTGGLIGWGHPTGATGVHQAVTILEQLTGNAGANQIDPDPKRPYGLTVNMGGDDKTLVAIVYKRG